jgi:hypothetical protein
MLSSSSHHRSERDDSDGEVCESVTVQGILRMPKVMLCWSETFTIMPLLLHFLFFGQT